MLAFRWFWAKTAVEVKKYKQDRKKSAQTEEKNQTDPFNISQLNTSGANGEQLGYTLTNGLSLYNLSSSHIGIIVVHTLSLISTQLGHIKALGGMVSCFFLNVFCKLCHWCSCAPNYINPTAPGFTIAEE